MRREHTHRCTNRKQGCRSTWICRQDAVWDPDGSREWYCPNNPTDSEACEDCFTSLCDECGVTLNIAKHESDCPKATAV